MKNYLYKTLIAFVLLAQNLLTYAYDFESDGIYYNLNHNEKTAAVTSKGNNERYTGILVIPKSIRYNGVTYRVTSIGSSAFYGCSELTSITIPNSVTSIGDYAFADCSGLTSVTIPNSVTSIGADAFFYCTGLTSVTIPNSVTSIRWGAFSGCSGLVSIAVSSGNTKYDSRNNCNAIIETSSNTLIIGCKNTIIPNSVRSIGLGAFAECSSLTSITIPNSVTSINNSAFIYCRGLTSITIPNSVTSIGDKAFWACSRLSSVIIGYSVTSIGRSAFYGCSELTSITIPNSVTSIGDDAFYGCNGLTSVISEIQNPFDISNKVFYGIPTYAILLVPKGTKSKYEAFSGWKMNFKEIVEAEDSRNYDLTISSSGYGSVSYNGASIRDCSQTFIVEEGTNTTVTFTPDNGYRIASVKLNNTDVTSSVANNNYTISNITANTTLAVTFEAIPPTTYSLSITASGNGSATYNSTSIRNNTQSFTVNEGSNATVSFTPDAGYRIKRLMLNNTDVTSNVSNNKYTISNITTNEVLAVTFEAIPETTYSLSITASGDGSASYNSTTIRNNTQSFTVNEGANATVTFTPDNGYRIANVKVNNTDVTTSVANNRYTIENIAANTTLAVTFEAIPPTTYSLNITASGNGSVTYSGATINNQTQSFTVNEGASAMLTFNPDNGYRVGSVKVNNTDVTSGVVNNRYTISNITANTTVSVAFEAIPETTYSLSITASGNGSVTYNGTTIKNQTRTFTVNEGAYATLALSAESGYRIASVRVNGSDDTYSVTNNQYTISYISQNTTVEVTFEAIPIPTYSLSITATGNGSAAFNGTTVKNQTRSFTVDEGTTATVTFSPDNGNSVSTVKVNGNDVTSQISANRYTISSITANTTLEVTFQEDVNALTVDGLNYIVTSQSNKTVTFTGGDFGLVLTVPATITQNGTTWKVTGIDNNALKDNTELAAIIWNPEAVFTATVSNPNLLLYVKSSQYAPSTIKNVVVNGTSNSITLTDAATGNNFYCPQAFTAQSITYTHHYSMMTGIGESRGWETIALPFDVQKIEHASKGAIVPFAQWRSGDTTKPFWLYELKSNGFVEASSIKANTPYIISMPNNPQYADQYQLVGNVTFSAENVTVSKSDNLQQPKYNDRTFVPNYQVQPSSLGYYALNVSNDYFTNNSGMTDGSRFVLNMRRILPFEAYMTTSSTNAPESIGIFDDMATEIQEIPYDALTKVNSVYDLQGRKIEKSNLTKGVYIRNGQKVIIR